MLKSVFYGLIFLPMSENWSVKQWIFEHFNKYFRIKM